MTESRPSKAQERFLKNEKRHHLLVGSARFLVFFLFAGLWELSADLGMIDSFIFSSPSRIVLCFYTMTMDKSIFLHIGITLYETLISFFLTVLISVTLAVLLWANRTASQIAEPYLVMLNSCSGAPAYRLARQPYAYDHSGCGFSGSIWLYFDLVYRIHPDRPGSDPPDPLPGRLQKGCSHKSSASILHPPSHQHHEGEHRAMSGRSDHR